MRNISWLNELFQAIDKQDTSKFLSFLTDEVFFRFGNAEPVHGKNNVGNIVKGFFESVKTIQHDITEAWTIDNTTVCHGFVTYTRHDDTTLMVPFANIFNMEGNKICEYLIYADISQLYQ
ncbi:nuclear transport factor 2 family protein [Kaarinaea lacus]